MRVRFGSGTHSMGDTTVIIDTSKYELAVSKMSMDEIRSELENLLGIGIGERIFSGVQTLASSQILDDDDRIDYAILTNELDRRKS